MLRSLGRGISILVYLTLKYYNSILILYLPKQLKTHTMKKHFLSAALLSLVLLLFGCSNNSSNDGSDAPLGTLSVNGVNYPIGTNIPGAVHNYTMFTQSGTTADDETNMTFSILDAGSISAETTQNILVSVSYPGNQSSINGTYPVNVAPTGADPISGAVVGFSNSAANYGDGPELTGGTVTVTAIGGDVYKIQFNNVLLHSSTATDSRTISGYCQTSFVPSL
jgi:hypothetical protein